MPKCTHRGCEREFDEASNNDQACVYHPSGPIFHEGLKGWSCCSKRVTDFDEFIKIPGCTVGRHSSEPLPTVAKSNVKSSQPDIPQPVRKDNTEIYSNGVNIQPKVPVLPFNTTEMAGGVDEKAITLEIPEDDLSIPVAASTTCKRRGCGIQYVNDSTSRGDGPQAQCNFHPGAPIFHEGSKGWSCCSRKVLDFEEFLKIKGCRTGNHLFVGPAGENASEQLVESRQDWYQTPTHVIITYFAKKTIKEQSNVTINHDSLSVNLRMPDGKVFKKSFPFFQPVEPDNSTTTFFGTKVEISLKKANGLSWASLEPTNNVTSFTSFGVQGGTAGTVGGKEMYIAGDAPLHAIKD